MSKYTIPVDQFLLNKLQPEIDLLNLSLISMEENGYDSKPMRDTRNKLNKLSVIYDFLKEYAYGKEDIPEAQLNDIMKIVGSYSLSNKSGNQIVQSTRDTTELNELGGCLDFIRVYMNGEILTTTTLPPFITPVEFKIYGSTSLKSISVGITVTDMPEVVYTGINNVTIQDIHLEEMQDIVLDITTINICGITNNVTMNYKIQNVNPSALLYWIGSTTERFTIDTSITFDAETFDITVNPNAGSAVGTTLDYNWVLNSPDMKDHYYLDPNHHALDTKAGDAHALIVVPSSLTVSNIGETVFGTNALMTQGVHYDVFPINSGAYNVYYFRDLTNIVFPKRQFQFDVTQ